MPRDRKLAPRPFSLRTTKSRTIPSATRSSLILTSRQSSLILSTAKDLVLPLLLVPLFLTLTPTQAAAQTITPADEQSFAQAMTALNAGQPGQAEPVLAALHRRHPDIFEINEALGLLYASTGHLAEALPLLKAAAAEQPQSDVAHANLGTDYLKLGNSRAATSELTQAVTLNPRDAETQNALAQAWMLEKQPCKANQAFAASAALAQPDADGVYNHALAAFDCGQPQAAATLLAGLPDLDTNAPAESLLGDADEQLKQYKDAAQHYMRAAVVAPTEPNIYVMGMDFLRHWTFDAAIKDFQEGLQMYPDSRRMETGLGIAYYGNANYDQAIAVFNGLLAQDPDNAMYGEIYGRSCTLLTEGNDPKCDGLAAFAEAHPANAQVATYAATKILHGAADPTQNALAEKLLRQALAHDPKLADAHYQLGFLLQNEGQWAQSVDQLQTAIAIDPTLAQAHYRLGLAYAHLGRRDEAQKEMAIDRTQHQQQQQDLNARMQRITTLLVQMH